MLRLLTPAEADAIDAEHTPEQNGYSWFGARRPGALRRRVESGQDLAPDHGNFAISENVGSAISENVGSAISENVGSAISENVGSAISDDAGRLLGEISWRRIQTGPTPHSFCWELGLYVLLAERGRGAGTEAQRLMAAYLFDTTLAQRVQASTDVTNLAEQRALQKAGFTREGILRGIQFRFGEWHDMVSYSKLRGEA